MEGIGLVQGLPGVVFGVPWVFVAVHRRAGRVQQQQHVAQAACLAGQAAPGVGQERPRAADSEGGGLTANVLCYDCRMYNHCRENPDGHAGIGVREDNSRWAV